MNLFKKRLKNEKGLTLIELLAVVVILGIIAAIAIPSIGGLIKNSERDAHLANAQQMVNSTRTAITANELGTATSISLKDLIDQGYIEKPKNPTNKTGGYSDTGSEVTISTGTPQTFTVKLVDGTTDTLVYLTGDPFTLTRKDVKLKNP